MLFQFSNVLLPWHRSQNLSQRTCMFQALTDVRYFDIME